MPFAVRRSPWQRFNNSPDPFILPPMRKRSFDEVKARQARRGRTTMPVAVFVENVRSLHNVGSFFRTGDGAGIERVYLAGGTGTPPRKEIAKVALGAEEVIPWEYDLDPRVMAHRARDAGYRLIAVEHTDASTDLFETALPFPCCLVFGHEVDGVSDELLDECEMAIEVPMFGTKESLNVSVCAGVVLYEVRRKWRMASGKH